MTARFGYLTTVATPTTTPKAYSYIRFSTPEQAEGDSLERQTLQARVWAAKHGVELDTELTLLDAGISAYVGRNVETGALGQFLEAVREGLVPRGSWLLVESLDRISRQTVHKAAATMSMIVSSGVTVVDLSDNERQYSEEAWEKEPSLFLMMAIRFMRANEESTLKAARVAGAFKRKREELASDRPLSKPFTRQLPAWIWWNDDTKAYELRKDRAKIVRKMFKWADEGRGQHWIAQRLNTEGIEPWGAGKRKARHWHRTYIKKILTSEAAIGAFTPHMSHRDPVTKRKVRKPLDPIQHRYPAVIDRDLFARVVARAQATAPRGRHAGGEVRSIFAGVLKCVHCGSTVTRVAKGRHVYLVCTRAHAKAEGCKYEAVPYGDVERAIRARAQAIIDDAPRGRDDDNIDLEIAGWDEHVSELGEQAQRIADELVLKSSETLRAKLLAVEGEWNAARVELRDLRARRDTFAGPYVLKRLETLRDALQQDPFSVSDANKALKQAARSIVFDPKGNLTIYWHHSDTPTENIPFWSKRGGFGEA